MWGTSGEEKTDPTQKGFVNGHTKREEKIREKRTKWDVNGGHLGSDARVVWGEKTSRVKEWETRQRKGGETL